MAKKIETPAVVASGKLIIGKDEFKKQIEGRISKGKELLIFPVRQVRSYDNHYTYDEMEKNNFFSESSKWNSFNNELLERSFDVPNNKYKKEYEDAVFHLFFGGGDTVKEEKEDIEKRINVLESFIDRLPLIPTATEPVKIEAKAENKPTNKVFIVHGHDEAIKQTVARTLSKLGLDPVILHEQPDQGRTIIEKFERDSSDVNFAIILLTADDEGKAKTETDNKARARQNVVFEMGYFIGKLGREKVFLLLENGVDKPGDLDGIVYVPIDTADRWRFNLVKELKAAGHNVTADDVL
jgi:predicted nucleotide-binding protein